MRGDTVRTWVRDANLPIEGPFSDETAVKKNITHSLDSKRGREGRKEARCHARGRWQGFHHYGDQIHSSVCMLAGSTITLLVSFYLEISIHISSLTSPGRCIS